VVGQEAVQAAEGFRPDLVLLDIGLPRLNGYEAAPRIRPVEPVALEKLLAGPLPFRKSHRAEVGYGLAKRSWGRGIMTAVVQRVCRHAFENR
jgi:hypothetical protein